LRFRIPYAILEVSSLKGERILEIEDKIQWHPAFCSAVELELREYKGSLSYEREHSLGKMPLRIDFLVVKKKPESVVKNEIGRFFLGDNLFEYKSPYDEMNAGTFYKVMAYAFLYRSEKEGAEESLEMDITATLVREEKPVKLLKQLGRKYKVTREGRGIYRIGGLPFPLQILVTGELDSREHVWVTSLTRELDRERAERLLDSAVRLEDETDRKNADSVINVASEANRKLFREMIQEGGQMCEELKELLAPEIVEYKIRLADNAAELADKDAKLADKDAKLADKDAKLADNAAEIAKLKKLLAEAGIEA